MREESIVYAPLKGFATPSLRCRLMDIKELKNLSLGVAEKLRKRGINTV